MPLSIHDFSWESLSQRGLVFVTAKSNKFGSFASTQRGGYLFEFGATTETLLIKVRKDDECFEVELLNSVLASSATRTKERIVDELIAGELQWEFSPPSLTRPRIRIFCANEPAIYIDIALFGGET